ncbi:MAG TPA: hypothetical protein VFM54_19925, partial [Micromonosporaceae bacterium]|nr:hypothetical protein [Micromonosporaceae bacterium]
SAVHADRDSGVEPVAMEADRERPASVRDAPPVGDAATVAMEADRERPASEVAISIYSYIWISRANR